MFLPFCASRPVPIFRSVRVYAGLAGGALGARGVAPGVTGMVLIVVSADADGGSAGGGVGVSTGGVASVAGACSCGWGAGAGSGAPPQPAMNTTEVASAVSAFVVALIYCTLVSSTSK